MCESVCVFWGLYYLYLRQEVDADPFGFQTARFLDLHPQVLHVGEDDILHCCAENKTTYSENTKKTRLNDCSLVNSQILCIIKKDICLCLENIITNIPCRGGQTTNWISITSNILLIVASCFEACRWNHRSAMWSHPKIFCSLDHLWTQCKHTHTHTHRHTVPQPAHLWQLQYVTIWDMIHSQAWWVCYISLITPGICVCVFVCVSALVSHDYLENRALCKIQNFVFVVQSAGARPNASVSPARRQRGKKNEGWVATVS